MLKCWMDILLFFTIWSRYICKWCCTASNILLSNRINKGKSISYKKDGSDLVPVENSEIQRLLEEPNERMTQTDFFEKVYWQLFLNYNAFIVPTYYRDNKGNKKYTGLYPIQPIDVTFCKIQREN